MSDASMIQQTIGAYILGYIYFLRDFNYWCFLHFCKKSENSMTSIDAL